MKASINMCLVYLLILTPVFFATSISLPTVLGETPYSLTPFPAFTQEGNTVSLVLSVSFGGGITLNNQWQFIFYVRDPMGRTTQSTVQNYTTLPGQDKFTLVVVYPSGAMPGSNSLVGQYSTWVDQLAPVASPRVASNSFILSLTDNASYQRTETVNIRGSGYLGSEVVTVSIRTQTTSTLVFSRTLTATSGGIVTTSWVIPRNATVDNYVVTLTGAITTKTPPDVQSFFVRAAIMTISGISSSKATYQRTETMSFSFQPTYPDGSIASTGVALLTLGGPSGPNVTLTATYDSPTQAFVSIYKTSFGNDTGTWTASLGSHAYSDSDGNTGPGTTITGAPQLLAASLAVTVGLNPSFAVGQQSKFNVTIAYPDGTILQSGSVGAFLLYSGTPAINESVPVVFDTGLNLWIGTYTPTASDAGGLWSLVVKASDSPNPPNTGLATRAVTLQNNNPSSGGNVSFPLYFFGIIAAIIAGLLGAFFFLFKKRRVTHANLKIDLEAVRSEAGRIESQDFFQSIKDQVKREGQDSN